MTARGKSNMFDVDWQAEEKSMSSYLKGMMEPCPYDTDDGAGGG